jgi:hypothetical protein
MRSLRRTVILLLAAIVTVTLMGCNAAPEEEDESAAAGSASSERQLIDVVFAFNRSMRPKVDNLKRLPQLSHYFGYQGSLDDRAAMISWCATHTCAFTTTNAWQPFIEVDDDEDPLGEAFARLDRGEIKLHRGPDGKVVHLAIVVASNRDTALAEGVFNDAMARFGLAAQATQRNAPQGEIRYHVFAQTCRSDEQKEVEQATERKRGRFLAQIVPRNLQLIAGRSGGLAMESCSDSPDLTEWSKALYDLSVVAEGGVDVAQCPLVGPELTAEDATRVMSTDPSHTSMAPECRLTPINVDGKQVEDDIRGQWCQFGSCGRTGDATCVEVGERSRKIRFKGPKGDVCQRCVYDESVCGSHSTCRGHDACYFRCYAKNPYSENGHSPFASLGRCILQCDLWAVQQSGLSGIQWALGQASEVNPYDRWLPYSTGPIAVERVSCDEVPR